jgi:hypothetical protein
VNGDAAALAGLIDGWGRYYAIDYCGTMYHAERRDNGARVHEADPGQLHREIEADYRARPVILPAAWDRAAWEQRIKAAGLSPGVLATALDLGGHADEHGIARPGNAALARAANCSTGTISGRLFRLRLDGFVIREGLDGWGGTVRYRLVIPLTPDVGQSLQGNAGFS